MPDKELLAEYGRLAKAHMHAIVDGTYQQEKDLQTKLRDTYDEIQARIAINQWQPVKVRQKRW